MGFLTTITLNNDRIDEILANPREFCERLNAHASSLGASNRLRELGFLVIAHTPIHSSRDTIYVQIGGGVYEMSAASGETMELYKEHPEIFKEALKYMREEVRDLERISKDT